jgi:uncharacterized protein (DUF58 family)
MYVLLGVLLLSRFFSRTWAESLEATRSCDVEVLEIGESAEVEVEVRNNGLFSIPWVIIEDWLPRDALVEMPRHLTVEGPRLTLTRLSPGESQQLNYRISFLMRGYYQLGPLTLETGDVFGLHRRFRVAAEPHFALVLPKVLPLRGYNLASRRPIGEIRVAHRLFEDPTLIAGIRPYQQGDPISRIHWRATARTGQLHSRIYETSRVAGATFLLDFHQESFHVTGAVASAELAVTTVASLANAVFLMGQQIGLISNGRDAADRIREQGWSAEFNRRGQAHRRASQAGEGSHCEPVIVETGKGADRFSELVQALARLECGVELDFAKMVSAAASRIPRDATVVPVLRKVTPAIAASLGHLSRQGFLVTVVVVAFGAEPTPDWARPPDWAEMLLGEGMDFRVVNSEEALTDLCAQAIVR